ncbi:hypothetical protein [Delftia tsuruhatensis]|uniref:Sel1 repeat family protein n=1 Tax=Delftia tsuruhatensis TaxID=180282 RepID=A0ABN4ST08_9BURK|nr:hypothetical protein [Delftia tsuruhatensis]AOV05790.1 hypothetical protein BI380_03755 [Delftia tsuruhatensis]
MTTSTLTSFSVTLQDCEGIKPDLKRKAEARFAKVIERSFPNPEAMTRAYKLFNDAAEGGVISKADEKTALSWLKAAEAAHQAGLQDIAVEEAFFQVRLA